MGIGVKRRIREARGFYGMNGIDEWLARRLDYRDGFFVELGANDGLQQSNTAFFERRRGWRGILIEPAMNRLVECRKNRTADSFLAACVSFDFNGDVVWLEYLDLMTGNMDRDRALAHMRPGESPIHFPAPARTLDSILREARAPSKIDLLSLDVEGAEVGVLRGTDHDAWRFKLIVVEADDLPPVEAELNAAGYALEEQITFHDYVFAPR